MNHPGSHIVPKPLNPHPKPYSRSPKVGNSLATLPFRVMYRESQHDLSLIRFSNFLGFTIGTVCIEAAL